MNEPIDEALIELQASLDQINDWASVIKNAEEHAGEAIKGASISIKSANDAINSIKGNYLLLTSILEKNSDESKASILKVVKEYETLGEGTKEAVGYLRSVNFPARLDKIDGTVSLVNQSGQNLSDKLDRVKDQLNRNIESGNQLILKQLSEQKIQMEKTQQLQNALLWGVLITGIISVGLLIYIMMIKGI